jgi:hypothetical protein
MSRSAAEQLRDALSATLFIFSAVSARAMMPIFRQRAEWSAALTLQRAFHVVDLPRRTQNC